MGRLIRYTDRPYRLSGGNLLVINPAARDELAEEALDHIRPLAERAAALAGAKHEHWYRGSSIYIPGARADSERGRRLLRAVGGLG